jgi:peptidoglycan hydrolase CwlO-like protein
VNKGVKIKSLYETLTHKFHTNFMRKILLYVIILIIAISGYNQVKEIWEENSGSLDATYSDVKEGVLGWYEKATDSSAELKETLNTQIKSATEKYENIKGEINSISGNINEKQQQLEQTLNEIEEAKNALNQLLGKDGEETVEEEVPVEETESETP